MYQQLIVSTDSRKVSTYFYILVLILPSHISYSFAFSVHQDLIRVDLCKIDLTESAQHFTISLRFFWVISYK